MGISHPATAVTPADPGHGWSGPAYAAGRTSPTS
jgi:hypothetical protein